MRPVDLTALDLRQRGVVRRCLDVLDAGDLGSAGHPVVRVLARTCRPAWRSGRSRRTGPTRPGAGSVKVAGFLTFDQMCFGTMNWPFSVDCDELRVGRLQVDRDLVRTLRLTDAMFDVRLGEPDHVHGRVLLAGREAVDDVGSRQWLPSLHFTPCADVQRQGLVAVRPLPALRKPRVLVAAACCGRDDEGLVERPADERSRREARGRVRVEVTNECGVARSCEDEAFVSSGLLDCCGRARCRQRETL